MKFEFNDELRHWEGPCFLRGREFELVLQAPQSTVPDELERLGSVAVVKIENVWPEIETRLVRDSLRLFIEDWGPAGDLPKLTPSEFLKKILLEYVTVGEDGSIELFFSDSDLFAGHYVQFFCRDGEELKGPNLFG